MANMVSVNTALRAAYPALDIEAVRGSGYVYFDGDDGFGKIDSIFAHPSSTSTPDMIRLVIDAVSTIKK